MASNLPSRTSSNTQLLEELEALSQNLYQSHISSTRRTTSLALPRSSAPLLPSADQADSATNEDRPRSRRMSLSPWRSRPKNNDNEHQKGQTKAVPREESNLFDDNTTPSKEKKGIWKWKPIRALSHIGMQKLSCLFSVEVVGAQGLPSSMNGLRLSVCVRKKETKDGAVHTMPSRVSQGAADFEETLFVKCHVYCTQSSGTQQLKFEPRPFLIYVFAMDAGELDFGRNSVDLTRLIQESLEKSGQGTRIRQWDTSFDLAGKAKGGQLLVKLAFQIMEKDGIAFNQLEGLKSGKSKASPSAFGRKQSKSSFSIPSPKITARAEIWTPSQAGTTADIQGIDELDLDEPAPPSSVVEPHKSKDEELDLPDFEVVDKGVEIQITEETKEKELIVRAEEATETSEVVKEMVHDQYYLTRLTELDSIAQQIKALESMMSEDRLDLSQPNEETDSQKLDAEEETVTMEFLQMLEHEEAGEVTQYQPNIPRAKLEQPKKNDGGEPKVFIPDLGKGLGCVVQTRNGGLLAATNPLNVEISRKDTPKLALQTSRPFVLTSDKSITGFELFQTMAAIGLEELSSEVLAMMPVEDLMGKTAEQVAFEGMASTIISGRKKEGASSSAARSVAALKKMANAMSAGRKERITTGIWNVAEDSLTLDEILAFSMQKIEVMSIDALKIQAAIAEENAPFDVSPIRGNQTHPLASAIPLEDWIKNESETEDSMAIILVMVIQLRDPIRRYEAVGGPLITLIHATPAQTQREDDQKKFRINSLHVGGIKVEKGQKRNGWDGEKQRLTAMQWLIAYNMGRKEKMQETKEQNLFWSISSRVVADMWLKPIRNPNVKFAK